MAPHRAATIRPITAEQQRNAPVRFTAITPTLVGAFVDTEWKTGQHENHIPIGRSVN